MRRSQNTEVRVEINVGTHGEHRAAHVAAEVNQAGRVGCSAARDQDAGEVEIRSSPARPVTVGRVDPGLFAVRAEHANVQVAGRQRAGIPNIINRLGIACGRGCKRSG